MKNKIRTREKMPDIEKMLDMPVVRKYVDMEWLSKISSGQFRAWVDYLRSVVLLTDDETKADKLIADEIERREKLYQLYKERRVLEKERDAIRAEKARFEKSYKDDMLYNLKTYDLVPTPATKNAVWSGNGRIYPKELLIPTATTKQHHYNKNWMLGEI